MPDYSSSITLGSLALGVPLAGVASMQWRQLRETRAAKRTAEIVRNELADYRKDQASVTGDTNRKLETSNGKPVAALIESLHDELVPMVKSIHTDVDTLKAIVEMKWTGDA